MTKKPKPAVAKKAAPRRGKGPVFAVFRPCEGAIVKLRAKTPSALAKLVPEDMHSWVVPIRDERTGAIVGMLYGGIWWAEYHDET